MTKLPFFLICSLCLIGVAMPCLAVEMPKFNTTLDGERNIGTPYEFTIPNVSGLKDAVYTVNTVTYRILENYTYYSVSWGQRFMEFPAPGKKFLFVWVRIDETGTSWWGWGQDRFFVWLWGNQTVKPEPVIMIDTDGEFKNGIHTSNVTPRMIYDIQNITGPDGYPVPDDVFGYHDGEEMDRITPGQPFEGYIIYQIPASIQPEDIRVAGWFRNFGTAYWNLVNRTVIQNSVEMSRYRDLEEITAQHRAGIRFSDKYVQRRSEG
jgi:hypothetical protein